jgi:hypothetical protein
MGMDQDDIKFFWFGAAIVVAGCLIAGIGIAVSGTATFALLMIGGVVVFVGVIAAYAALSIRKGSLRQAFRETKGFTKGRDAH